MSTDAGFPLVEVAVALVTDADQAAPQAGQGPDELRADQRLLWIWNENWGCFALPMTKVRKGQGNVEPPRHAAVRAAAEVLGVPVEVAAPLAVVPEIEVSDREYVVKRYTYHVFRARAHADYGPAAWRLPRRHLWLPAHAALSGLFEPLSKSACDLLGSLVQQGFFRARRQETSVVIITQGEPPERKFLLRWNPRWGYALPAKRKGDEEPLAAAERVMTDELGVAPGAVKLRPLRPEPVRTCGMAVVKEKPGYGAATDYGNRVFEPEPPFDAPMNSAQPVYWATGEEIRAGIVDDPQPVEGTVPPSRISPTVFQLLAELDLVPWV